MDDELSLISDSQLLRYVEASGENDNIDAKAAMSWDQSDSSAGLAKDIAAFSNSRDGGVIVIGKPEINEGGFDLSKGCTREQSRSFETTRVAQWVNERFLPPIQLTVHHIQREHVRFVVIVVREFHDVPVICVKDYQKKGRSDFVLKKGQVYVRNSNAASAPLSTPDDVRTLIQLASMKRRDDILKQFSALMKSGPLLPVETDAERFQREISKIENALDLKRQERMSAGGWYFWLYPAAFRNDRLSVSELLPILLRHQIRRGDRFPVVDPQALKHDPSCLFDDEYPEFGSWMFACSGQFHWQCQFPENEEGASTQYSRMVLPDKTQSVGPGKWLRYEASLFSIIEMLEFSARMAHEMDASEDVCIEIKASGLRGRSLLSAQLVRRNAQVARRDEYCFRRQVSKERWIAEWEDSCIEAMHDFVLIFSTTPPDNAHLRNFIAATR
jgi:hypothetical protein